MAAVMLLHKIISYELVELSTSPVKCAKLLTPFIGKEDYYTLKKNTHTKRMNAFKVSAC